MFKSSNQKEASTYAAIALTDAFAPVIFEVRILGNTDANLVVDLPEKYGARQFSKTHLTHNNGLGTSPL